MENRVRGIKEDFLSPQERLRLIGLCARISGNLDVAEDLAQETLFLAWRQMQNLRDTEKRSQWISGIARNVCLRWLRTHERDLLHRESMSLSHEENTLEELVADEDDLEIELERKELIELLERALKLLPSETREILIRRYVEESPLAEIAAQVGSSPNAVAMRLQRGRLALKKVLLTDLQQEISAYEITTSQTWETTSIWCRYCGNHQLLGYKDSKQGLFYLKCPQCSPGTEVLNKTEADFLTGAKSYKPTYQRLLKWCDQYYRKGLREGSAICQNCGRKVKTKIGSAKDLPESTWLNDENPFWSGRHNPRLINIYCPDCRGICQTSLEGLILSLPEGLEFSKRHPRIHLLPERTLEFAGRPAIVTSFENKYGSERFEVISDAQTYGVLQIYGGAR